jgi:nicotinamide-nucleotide amidase
MVQKTDSKIEAIAAHLKRLRLSLSVAESATCGALQSEVGRVSGASEFFLGGLTAYSLEQKVRHLNVTEWSARQANCVSEDVAHEMARGVSDLFGSCIGVATTGYAEPNKDWDVKVPYCHIAIWSNLPMSIVSSVRFSCPGLTRNDVRGAVVAETLRLLELHLQDL